MLKLLFSVGRGMHMRHMCLDAAADPPSPLPLLCGLAPPRRQVSMDSLQVMDETAITLCKENNIPVIVFNIMEKGNILKVCFLRAHDANVGSAINVQGMCRLGVYIAACLGDGPPSTLPSLSSFVLTPAGCTWGACGHRCVRNSRDNHQHGRS